MLHCSFFADAGFSRRKPSGNVAVSIAVVGMSGVGKSSFINSIRGLDADDQRAAAVGVTETTVQIDSYTHPYHPNITFWDLPGVGTDRFPQAEYLRLITVDRYDFFVVMSATRFYETDAWLVNQVSKRGKKFVFVRTKVDIEVRNNKKAHPRSHNEDTVLEQIATSTKEHLTDIHQTNAEVFLIDSYAKQKYDFKLLADKLLYELPESKASVMTKRSCVIS